MSETRPSPGRTAPRPLGGGAADAAAALFAELDRLAAAGRPAPCQIGRQSHWWTSDDPERLAVAAELCKAHCPALVRALCREYADAARASWGTWGGGVRLRGGGGKAEGSPGGGGQAYDTSCARLIPIASQDENRSDRGQRSISHSSAHNRPGIGLRAPVSDRLERTPMTTPTPPRPTGPGGPWALVRAGHRGRVFGSKLEAVAARKRAGSGVAYPCPADEPPRSLREVLGAAALAPCPVGHAPAGAPCWHTASEDVDVCGARLAAVGMTGEAHNRAAAELGRLR